MMGSISLIRGEFFFFFIYVGCPDQVTRNSGWNFKKNRRFSKARTWLQNIRTSGANWRCPFQLKKWRRSMEDCSSCSSSGTEEVVWTKKRWPLLDPIISPNPSQNVYQMVYHKSQNWFSLLRPHNAPLALRKPITNSPTMARLLVS